MVTTYLAWRKIDMFNSKKDWYRYSDYRVENDVIVPIGSEIIKYNLFDYFSLVRRKRPETSRITYENIQKSFVNIDIRNPDEVCKWVKKFGVPYSKYEDNKGEIHNNIFVNGKPKIRKLIDKISVEEFGKIVRDYREIINLHNVVYPISQNYSAILNVIKLSTLLDNYYIMITQLDMETTQAAEEYVREKKSDLKNNIFYMSSKETPLFEEMKEWAYTFEKRVESLEMRLSLFKDKLNLSGEIKSVEEWEMLKKKGILFNEMVTSFDQWIRSCEKLKALSDWIKKLSYEKLELIRESVELIRKYRVRLKLYEEYLVLQDEMAILDEEIVEWVKLYINLRLEYMTQDVREQYKIVDGHLEIGWNSPSLLGLLYKMLTLEWNVGANLIKCKHKYCCNYFIPIDHTVLYCSEQCNNNGKQMNFRNANKESLALKRRQKAKQQKKATK